MECADCGVDWSDPNDREIRECPQCKKIYCLIVGWGSCGSFRHVDYTDICRKCYKGYLRGLSFSKIKGLVKSYEDLEENNHEEVREIMNNKRDIISM